MKVGIIGTGYVGIVTGACLAERGVDVTCFDIDENKIATYSKGKSAIFEPGLEELLQNNLKKGTLHFTTEIKPFVAQSDILFLCVGTPPLPDGSADLSQVESAVREIAENSPEKSYKVIVEKSTVPVGTHKRLKNITKLYNKGRTEFDFVVNSEFLREGSAVADFLNPDRIVIGVESKKAEKMMLELYKGFKTSKQIVDPSSAEIIKYASNSFLALKISFINMVADLCEKVGANVGAVADGMGADKRIGRAFLNAGIGYGGSCFPKDVKAFVNVLQTNGVNGSILQSVDSFNEERPSKIVRVLEEELWILKHKEIAIWGLAFKPDTDDIREAPALKVIEQLAAKDVNLRLYDPEAMPHVKGIFPPSRQIRYFDDPVEAVQNAESLVVMTEWLEFYAVKPEELFAAMKLPVVVDGRNVFDAKAMIKNGFRYFPIGKGEVNNEMKRSK